MNLNCCTVLLVILLLCLVDLCGSLICWHCIAENCDTNPEDNHRAEQRHCQNGHVCQKVVFGMQSDVEDKKYKSTVRSCSEDCIPQNDYLNCSNDLYITRGCVKRACCSDSDLCNGLMPLHPHRRFFNRTLFVLLLQSLSVFGVLVLLIH